MNGLEIISVTGINSVIN